MMHQKRQKGRPVQRYAFKMPQIADMIELAIFNGYSNRSIAKAFGCSDLTVGRYINLHYFGITKGKTIIIQKQSKLNFEFERGMAA